MPARVSLRTSIPVSLAALLAVSCAMLPPGMRGEAAAPPASAQVDEPSKPGAPIEAAKSDGVAPKVYPGTGQFVNPRPPAPPAPPGPEEASLNFEGLDVREVAKVILGDYLKASYTVHPQVTGTVTFRTVRAIPLKELLPTLEMLLRQNNAAVVLEEGVYKILPIGAVRGSISPQLGGTALPIPQGYSIVVVPLRFVGAREMVKLLEPFAADNTIRVDDVRNMLVIAGNQREMRHLLDTIDLFDVDWLSGYSVGLFPVKSADVKTLTQDLDKLFGAQAQSPLAGIVRVIPIERLNSLLIVTTQARYLDVARSWLERLDQAGGGGSGGNRIYVYQVKNGKAENLAQLIGDLFSARRTTTTAPSLAPGARPAQISSSQPFGTLGQPTTGSTTTTTVTPPPAASAFTMGGVGTTANEVRVIADKDTNSLLIVATPGDYEVIETALRKLDVLRRQVLVEVLLAEVTLTDNLTFGIDWFIRARGNTTNGTVGTTNFGGGLPGPTSASNQQRPRTLESVPASDVLQLINLTGGEVRAVLNALGADGKTKILAAPQIMVLDNEKAEIKVGDRISVQTQTQSGVTTGVLNSFQYLETGILLAVTPRINSGGFVTLEVNQEVSVPKALIANNPNPDISTRNAKTSVLVASGDSIVLGGLIRENSGRTSSGIPLLSKIPVIGAAFGIQTLTRDRTELILLITPKIVSDTSQAREATEELKRKLPTLEGMLPKAAPKPAPAVTQ